MRGPLVAGVAVACGLAAATPAAAATRVVLANGPGGLLALDAAAGTAYAVVGRPDGRRPLGLLRSDGIAAGAVSAFGAIGARDPDVLAFPGGVAVTWARVVNGGMEYSVAPVTQAGVGAAGLLGPGPARRGSGSSTDGSSSPVPTGSATPRSETAR